MIKGTSTPFDDEATSIHNAQFIIHNEGAIYDLSGRKLDGKPINKGLYIRNGKKFVKE